MEEYDPATDTWTKKTDMPTPRWGLSAEVVNGRIYLIGGSDKGIQGVRAVPIPTVEEYTPEGWQLTAVSPQGKLTATWGEIKGSR